MVLAFLTNIRMILYSLLSCENHLKVSVFRSQTILVLCTLNTDDYDNRPLSEANQMICTDNRVSIKNNVQTDLDKRLFLSGSNGQGQ